MPFSKSWAYALMKVAFAACAMSAALLSGCTEQKPAFASVDVTGADYAKNFELTDHNGQVRHLTDFAGKVVVIFFGYTQCPDVCPT
jgi:protein SCO1/2